MTNVTVATAANIRSNLAKMVGKEFNTRTFAHKWGYISEEMTQNEQSAILSRIATELTQCRSTEDTFNTTKLKSKHAHYMTSMGVRLKVLRIDESNDGTGQTYLYRVDPIEDKPVARTIEGTLPSYIQIDYSKMVASIPDDLFMKEITRRFGN